MKALAVAGSGRPASVMANEPPALGRTIGIDGEPSPMDHDVMVEPTQRREVLGIGATSLGPGHDVMGLEAITARAAIRGAASVPMENVSAQPGLDDSSGSSEGKGVAAQISCGELHASGAQGPFQDREADSRAALNGDSGPPPGLGETMGVDVERDQGSGRPGSGWVGVGEGIDTDGGEGVCSPGRP
jgi:hypothetical protein